MCFPVNRPATWRVVLPALVCLVCSREATAQEVVRIKLKNGMSAPITVLIKSAQQESPTHIQISRDGVFNFRLDDEGPYSLQVIPDDQPNSGYHLGSHDLRLLAQVKQGEPVELKGDTVAITNPDTKAVSTERYGVYFEATGIGGRIERYGGLRGDYDLGMMTGDMKDAPKPTRTTAVMSVTVLSDARLLVDGAKSRQTGQVRFLETPTLRAGMVYWYDLTMEYGKDEQVYKDTRRVAVQVGETTRVNFLMPIAPPAPRPLLILPPVRILVPEQKP